MSSPLRFALGVVAVVVVLTGVLFVLFMSNPVSIGVYMARSALERAGYETATVDGPRGAQTYFHAGAGPKTVVLLHGMGHQAGAWIKTTTDLADRHAVIVPDLAGHGDSEPFDGALTLDDSVAGLAAILDAAVPDGPVVLVGNSMGGWVALRYALDRPDRVEQVVLVNSSGLRGDLQDVELLPKTREEARALVRAITPPTAPEPAGFVLDDLVDSIHEGPSPRQVAGVRDSDYVDERLGALSQRVDIVWGMEDRLLPAGYGWRFVDLLPNATFHELPGCGHIPQQQCPQPFNRLLYELLAR
ncbi:MAG: alpha/beta hydrolase [Acidobacteriota bacterium]